MEETLTGYLLFSFIAGPAQPVLGNLLSTRSRIACAPLQSIIAAGGDRNLIRRRASIWRITDRGCGNNQTFFGKKCSDRIIYAPQIRLARMEQEKRRRAHADRAASLFAQHGFLGR